VEKEEVKGEQRTDFLRYQEEKGHMIYRTGNEKSFGKSQSVKKNCGLQYKWATARIKGGKD